MKIESVFDASFRQYGKVVEGLHLDELLTALSKTEKTTDGVIYVPGDDSLENTPAKKELEDNVYGGMPIQIGFCNGTNTKLNCVEYHRDSEINIPCEDMILLLGKQTDITPDYHLDTATIRAFLVPAGTAVEVYATTLHYAPCEAKKGAGFRVAVVLPKGTNTDKPEIAALNAEDPLLRARNKWLIAHADASEAGDGAFVGLDGVNIDIANEI